MNYLVVVFKSRSESLSFLSIIKSYIKNVSIINTPAELKMPCGICIRMPLDKTNLCLSVLQRRNFSSFIGLYKLYIDKYSQRLTPFSF